MKKLIKNGYVISMDPEVGVKENCDILVEDDIIKKIAPSITEPVDEVIDAKNCYVIPGFVDTHRHTWQTQLKTVATDWTLFNYLTYIRMAYASFYNVDDAYLGNYAGAVESLNAGITTIVDHCHLINSPEFADRLIDGLEDSGTRAVFTYGYYVNPTYHPYHLDMSPGWRYEDSKRIRRERLHDDNARIIFGVNPSEYEQAPIDVIKYELGLCKELGANVISAHVGMGNYDAGVQAVRKLGEEGLLTKEMLFVHGAALTNEELDLIKEADAGMSSTPEVDMQMGMGFPMGLRGMKYGVKESLGVDIVSNYAAEMFTPMRTVLACQSALDNDRVAKELHKVPGKVYYSAKDALYLATLGGAEAIHMDDKIGSLKEGKKADLVMIRNDNINMPCYGDPYSAVVFYANTGDVDTVMVDGKLVKKDGKMIGVDTVSLNHQLKESFAHIQEGFNTVDHKQNEQFWRDLFNGFIYTDELN